MKPECRSIGKEINLPLIINGAWQMSEGHLLHPKRDLDAAGSSYLPLNK